MKIRITKAKPWNCFEKGEIILIKKKYGNYHIYYENGNEWGRTIGYSTVEECIEELKGYCDFEEVKDMEFTKDDLKTGMVVETRDGWVGMIVGNRIVGNRESLSLSSLEDDLLFEGFNNFDVLKIYEEPQDLLCFDELKHTENFKLLWERQEKSQAQIEIEELKKERDEFNKKMDERLAKLESELS